ncbi:MAG: hypothetical protein ACI4I6_03860, partial [Hominimerdicola sp.]
MKKSNKIILSIICTLILMNYNCFTIFAADTNSETQYEEEHTSIDLSNINISICNGEDFIMTVDKSKNIFKQSSGRNNINKIKKVIKENPEFENDLIKYVDNYNDIVAIGCTTAPLKEVNGELVRIEKDNSNNIFELKADAAYSKEDSDNYNKLTLSTWVGRVGYDSSKNKYHYVAHTTAYWNTDGLVIGNDNMPSYGNDYILQSVPKNFTITSDSCTTVYNKTGDGTNNDCWRTKSSTNYAYYTVKDRPSNYVKLTCACLTTHSYAKSTKS